MNVQVSEILKYLGYSGQKLEPAFLAEIDAAIEKVRSIARPKHVYKLFELTSLDSLLQGQDIKHHGKGAEKVLLMAATLGNEVDFFIRQLQNSDVKQASIIDAAASSTIEAYLDSLEENLRAEYLLKGLFLSARFSPGYGDFPLSVQQDFLTLLDAHRRIGLSLGKSGIMSPLKSVTCVMALTKQAASLATDSCSICKLRESCTLRRRGLRCK